MRSIPGFVPVEAANATSELQCTATGVQAKLKVAICQQLPSSGYINTVPFKRERYYWLVWSSGLCRD
eukprot:g57236.t1